MLGTANFDVPETPTAYEGAFRGEHALRALHPTCGGLVGTAPDLNVLTSVDRDVTFDVNADGDATLLLRLPDGTLVCDDDSGEGRDPRIRRTLRPGLYQVWVGRIGRRGDDFTLRVAPAAGS